MQSSTPDVLTICKALLRSVKELETPSQAAFQLAIDLSQQLLQQITDNSETSHLQPCAETAQQAVFNYLRLTKDLLTKPELGEIAEYRTSALTKIIISIKEIASNISEIEAPPKVETTTANNHTMSLLILFRSVSSDVNREDLTSLQMSARAFLEQLGVWESVFHPVVTLDNEVKTLVHLCKNAIRLAILTLTNQNEVEKLAFFKVAQEVVGFLKSILSMRLLPQNVPDLPLPPTKPLAIQPTIETPTIESFPKPTDQTLLRLSGGRPPPRTTPTAAAPPRTSSAPSQINRTRTTTLAAPHSEPKERLKTQSPSPPGSNVTSGPPSPSPSRADSSASLRPPRIWPPLLSIDLAQINKESREAGVSPQPGASPTEIPMIWPPLDIRDPDEALKQQSGSPPRGTSPPRTLSPSPRGRLSPSPPRSRQQKERIASPSSSPPSSPHRRLSPPNYTRVQVQPLRRLSPSPPNRQPSQSPPLSPKFEFGAPSLPQLPEPSSFPPRRPANLPLPETSIEVPQLGPKPFIDGDLNEILPHQLKIEKSIHHGGYSEISLASFNSQNVAVKSFVLPPGVNTQNEFLQDALFMCRSSPFHIVKILGACTEPGKYSLVMEYAKNGSLFSYLRKPVQEIPWELNYSISVGIVKALSFLHSQNIVHRDLKSSHVLLDEGLHPKLCDFGFSQTKVNISLSGGGVSSSARWRSPESLKRGYQPTPSSDIFSLGTVLWELASRQVPFSSESDESAVVNLILSGKTESIPENCPLDFASIIQNCWDAPENRPATKDLLPRLYPSVKKDVKMKSWHFDPLTERDALGKGDYQLLDATKSDIEKCKAFYYQCPAPGFEVASVKVIYNKAFNTTFECYLKSLQSRGRDQTPSWKLTQESEERERILKHFHDFAKEYTDPDYPNVLLLPGWHGTKPQVLDSIFKVGYTNLAVTDCGFFGKGLYSTLEAAYAHATYYKGALVFNWIACLNVFPVLEEDIKFLIGNANMGHCDAHFIPVVPKEATAVSRETCFVPCKVGQQFKFREIVVFQTVSCLPRYLVELKPTLPTHRPPSIPTSEAYDLANQLYINTKYREALKHYEIAISESYPAGLLRLGIIYRFGDSGIPKNLLKSDELFRHIAGDLDWFERQAKATKEGDDWTNLALFFKYISKDEKNAAKNFQKGADTGYALAQDFMGGCWKNAQGVGKDEEMAIRCYQNAARQGLAQAQCNLGVCFANGTGASVDLQMSAMCYQLAANQGYPPAQFNLALSYKSGLGLEKDEQMAIQYYKLAGRVNKYAPAQFNLAVSYQNGTGVEKDQNMAMKYYQNAADQGYPPALFNLGVNYESGVTLGKNEKLAISYFQQAADEGGYAPAQHYLGLCYQKGRVLKKDPKMAIKYFQMAADQGYARGFYNLGLCFMKGLGVEKNEKLAFQNLTQALENGVPQARAKLNELKEKRK